VALATGPTEEEEEEVFWYYPSILEYCFNIHLELLKITK